MTSSTPDGTYEVMNLTDFDSAPKQYVLEVSEGFRPPLVLTRFGRIVALLVPITDGETIAADLTDKIRSGEIQP